MIDKKLVVTVDQYTTQDGQVKKKYLTIGHVHNGQYGPYVTIEPNVDLSGIRLMQQINGLGKENDSRIFCNLYDADQRDQSQPAPAAPAKPLPNDLEDDIPF